jgi:hypothetical protein
MEHVFFWSLSKFLQMTSSRGITDLFGGNQCWALPVEFIILCARIVMFQVLHLYKSTTEQFEEYEMCFRQ